MRRRFLMIPINTTSEYVSTTEMEMFSTSQMALFNVMKNPQRTSEKKMSAFRKQPVHKTTMDNSSMAPGIRQGHNNRAEETINVRTIHQEGRTEDNTTSPAAADVPPVPPPVPPLDKEQPHDGGFGAKRASMDQKIWKEELHEKREYLKTMHEMGIKHNLTEENSLSDIEYTHMHHSQVSATDSSVSFIKSIFTMLIKAINTINRRTNLLMLEGWESSMMGKLEKGTMDRGFKSIYNKLWRKGGSVNPLIELAWHVFGGLIMTHFFNKIGGGGGAPPRVPLHVQEGECAHKGSTSSFQYRKYVVLC